MHGAELRTMAKSVNHPTLSAPLVGTKWGRSLLMFNFGIEGKITRISPFSAAIRGSM